jgi:hypothetical protein
MTVPGDSATIQAAIKGVSNWDTVLVADGHYFERLNLLGKSLLVTSEIMLDGDTMHMHNTILDGDSSVLGSVDTGSVVRADGYFPDPPSALIRGFTIRNGFSEEGGGIYCRLYNLELRHCVLRDNVATKGGVAYLFHSGTSLVLDSCTIEGGNQSIASYYSWLKASVESTEICELKNCVISETQIRPRYPTYLLNSELDACTLSAYQSNYFITNSELDNCNIEAIDDGFLTIENSLLFSTDSHCDAFSGAGISHSVIEGQVTAEGYNLDMVNSTVIGTIDLGLSASTYRTIIQNCIIATEGSPAVTCGSPDSLSVICCDISGCNSNAWLDGGAVQLDTSNVFFLDPQFCDPDSGDYTVYNTSPCLPQHNNCGVLIGALGYGCYSPNGDVNGSGAIDLDDVIYLIQYIFESGPPPESIDIADVDCSSAIDIDDVVYLIHYIFADGPPPCLSSS